MKNGQDTSPDTTGRYHWSADGVPNNGQGTATFDATASTVGATANASVAVEMDPYYCIVNYVGWENNDYHWKDGGEVDNGGWFENYSAQADAGEDGKWHLTYNSFYYSGGVGFHEGWPWSGSSTITWSDSDPLGTEVDNWGEVGKALSAASQ